MHPDNIRIASGDLGVKSTVYIWNTKTLSIESVFKNLSNGVIFFK